MIGIGIGFNIKGGRVLSNILGHDGNCESLTPFTGSGAGTSALSTTQKKSGTNSIKFTIVAQTRFLYEDITYSLDTTKQYILGCWVYIESWTSSIPQLKLYDVGTFTSRYAANADTSVIGSWQFIYVKIPISNTLVGTGFRLYLGIGTSGTLVSYFDEIRLYEVSASDYTAIGTTWTAVTTPSIDDIFPYRDTP